MKGKFITFEGGEGGGKSTQIELLCKSLKKSGCKLVKTREPGGTPQGEAIRAILVTGKASKISPLTELLLNLAARSEHVEKVIRPALRKGMVVISDRFSDSTIAYQGHGHKLGTAFVEKISRLAIGNFKPDLTIIFDLDPKKGLTRAKKRADRENRYEKLEGDFHARVRQGFLKLAKNEPRRCVVIDAGKSIESIHKQIISVVNSRFSLSLLPIRD